MRPELLGFSRLDASGRNPSLAPCLRNARPWSIHRAGCGASRPSADAWVGAQVRFASLGSGSAPSDPRLIYHIGNRGIRKSAKIRKIEKACFSQPISNPTTTRHNHPVDGLAEGKTLQDSPSSTADDGLVGMTHQAWSPLQHAPLCTSLPIGTTSGARYPMISFDSSWATTLESFSCCRDRNGCSGNGDTIA